MAGKGDKRRPYDAQKWSTNFDFWKKNEEKKQKKKQKELASVTNEPQN